MSDPKKKSPSTDEMIAALAEEFGLGDGAAAEGEPAADAKAASGQKKQSDAKTGGAKKEDKKDEKKAEKKADKKAEAPAAPQPKRSATDVEEIFDIAQKADAAPLDFSAAELDEGKLAEVRANRRTIMGLVITLLVVAAVSGGLLFYFLEERRTELAAAEIEPDSWVEMITDFDIHQQEIKEYKARKVEEEQRAKTPIFGHLRLETEPSQAFVVIDCLPMDAHCNNAGTKTEPRWENQYVKDEEIGDRKCSADVDCRDCKPAPPLAAGEAPPTPESLCRFPDARCAGEVCRLPMKTAITIQSLYVGTLAGLQADRKYAVRVHKPGWITETFEVGVADWETKMVPDRDDSDRTAVKRLELKPDPNAPEEIRKQVEEYIKKKADAEAAMMQEMEKWEKE